MKHRLPDAFGCAASVRRFIDRHSLLSGVGTVVLALSGGKDSVCLFHILREELSLRGVRFLCAHVHHGLRGETADRDEAFCKTLCADYGVGYRAFFCDVAEEARLNGQTIEEAARCARYRVLLDYCREENAVLATAHTASDVSETVLMQIARGGGLGAATGILPRRPDGVIRPLLLVTGEETLAFCNDGGYAFVTDETNTDTSFLRNHYRAHVLPAMRERHGNLDRALVRFSELAHSQNAALLRLSDEKLSSLGVEADAVRASRATVNELLSDPELRAVVYRLFSRLFSAAGKSAPLYWETFHTLCVSLSASPRLGSFLEVGEGFGILVEEETLFATKKDGEFQAEEPILFGERFYHAFDASFSLTRKTMEETDEKIHKIHINATFSCDKIKGVLTVRCRRHGDTYTVGGRTRTVKDLFSMRKIPQGMRNTFPLVCDEEGIVWIPGELPADRVLARVGEDAYWLRLNGGIVLDALKAKETL
ncbi:MAG: tRNA lysidine(34) synthetase TilS [Clostridia bacterium]|nr:tRNA lysidine(34) synthetase TilS [Clostridia bacterium]